MADPEAQQAHQDRPAERTEGPDRRAYPRYAVDCAAIVFPVSGSGQIHGRLSDLSLGGCRVAAEHRYTAGILVRVEVQFQLRGIAFRIVGVTAGSRDAKSFAIRFLDMSMRRRQELADVLEEVAAANATRETAQVAASEAAPAPAIAAVRVLAPAPPPKSIPELVAIPRSTRQRAASAGGSGGAAFSEPPCCRYQRQAATDQDRDLHAWAHPQPEHGRLPDTHR